MIDLSNLHHANLIVSHPESAVGQLEKELAKTSAGEGIHFDSQVVETFYIEEARVLSNRGRQRSRGERRFIIRGFDMMTKPAQNALLKIIEEPAEGVHFFLITSYPDDLLETIHSRVEKVTLDSTDDQMDDVEKKVTAFNEASDLPGRLKVMGKINEKPVFRRFVRSLLRENVARENPELARALLLCADWSADAGASLKQMKQLVAISASHSSD